MGMSTIRLSTLAVTALLLAVPTLSSASERNALTAFKWQQRVLMIFGPSDVDERITEQRAINVAGIDGLRERDMAIFSVLPGGLIAELGRQPEGDRQAIARDLRRRFDIAPDDFVVVLIGKDGAEKFRAGVTIPPHILFDIIDAMPMRQREMREREG